MESTERGAELMRILCTNDDGIHAPGLRALVDAVKDLATVTVVAPLHERSASAQSLINRTTQQPAHVNASMQLE